MKIRVCSLLPKIQAAEHDMKTWRPTRRMQKDNTLSYKNNQVYARKLYMEALYRYQIKRKKNNRLT